MRLRWLQEHVRASLFYVPLLFIVGAIVLAQVTLEIDARAAGLPDRLTATVDSARAVLTVIAGATLTFAAIAFSVSLLLISLASSQYSPRVAHGLFRDPFNKRVMGLVVGTFTYCLVVLRAVRGPLEDSGDPVVPSLSILFALALGLTSILAIVAFISHSAHSMDISRILHEATDEALARLGRSEAAASAADPGPGGTAPPAGEGFPVAFADHGWVQQIDEEALLRSLEAGATMRLETTTGRYAITDTPLCTIWPPPADGAAARAAVLSAVIVGTTRTMQQDVTYGVRQLADVALKALSPGINDPTTAQDALFHLGTVVRQVVLAAPRERVLAGEDGRRLLRGQQASAAEIVDLAFDEVRIAAAGAPAVQVYLLEILHLLSTSLASADRGAVAALRRQADLTLEISRRGDLPAADLERVRAAHRHRFGA